MLTASWSFPGPPPAPDVLTPEPVVDEVEVADTERPEVEAHVEAPESRQRVGDATGGSSATRSRRHCDCETERPQPRTTA